MRAFESCVAWASSATSICQYSVTFVAFVRASLLLASARFFACFAGRFSLRCLGELSSPGVFSGPGLHFYSMARSVLHDSTEEPPVSFRKFTIEEYHKLGNAGVLHPNDRVELIDGLLVQMAPIGPEHQFILEVLNDIFSEQKKGRFNVGPGRPIPIPNFNEPQPDMVLFKRGAAARRRHASPEEIFLVIEVSDTTVRYDSEEKLLAYENARIPEYWIVDVPAKVVRVFRLNQGKKYQENRSTEGSIRVEAFPDVIVRLDELF